MSELDIFINGLGARQTDPVAEIRQFAKELALGVHKGLWPLGFDVLYHSGGDGVYLHNDNIREFGSRRWNLKDWSQTIERLHGTGFIVNRPNRYLTITQAAFDLLQEAPPYNVFISYTHKESSAFALLLVTTLKHFGIQPFCDMSLVPGEDWHPELEKQIKKSEYFIVLIGKETHNSGATLREVKWALENEKIVIPIWHNEFEFKPEEWKHSDSELVDAIQRKHAVIVQKESAAGYNAAIAELLTNRFGITP